MRLKSACDYVLLMIISSDVARGRNEKKSRLICQLCKCSTKEKCTKYESSFLKDENAKTNRKKSTKNLKIRIYIFADLHVLRVVTNAVYQLGGLDFRGADFVNGGEEWEFFFHALGFQHVVDLFGGDGTLQSLV